MDQEQKLKDVVRERYGKIAEQGKAENAASCCGATSPSTKVYNIMMDDYIFGMSYDIYNNGLSAAGIRSNSFELTFSKSFGKRKQELMRTLFD